MSARPRVAVLIHCYNEALAIVKVVADFRSALPEAEIYVYDNNSSDSTVPSGRPRAAVLIPCYNEALAIAKVVADFRSALPEAEIYVYDNNSSDSTVPSARSAGAIVRHEGMQGKGHVVCRMFADVDADVYLLVDGDGTYDASSAPALVDDLLSGPCDMINGRRVETGGANYRPGHRIGNRVLTGLVKRLFRQGFNDMLSGYKAFSRRYVKSFPALSQGFEIETELIVHATH